MFLFFHFFKIAFKWVLDGKIWTGNKHDQVCMYVCMYAQYLTKVSTPLTFQQSIQYIFSRDNTIEMKLGYMLE